MKITKLEIPCTGYSIVADFYQGDETDILFVLPGYSSTRERQKELVTALLEKTKQAAFVIDYSGHGESPFKLRDTRPAQHALEVVIAFDWIAATYPNANISVLGTSYGGFLAAQLTKYRQFKKLVLRVPAIYEPSEFYTPWAIREDNQEEYTTKALAYRTDSQVLAHHPLLARARDFRGKTFVMVHDQDELVPKQTTTAFITAFSADSFTQPLFSHSVGDSKNKQAVGDEQMEAYQERIAVWLKN